jgi:addiction module HigA family antidote
MTKQKEKPLHPGLHIKNKILPSDLSVKDAAKLLGVGRPALSNLLNGKAALSPEMAVRLEKAFGASQEELLRLQAEFDQYDMRARASDIAVRAYVPAYLTIKARDIEQWSERNIGARSLLAVLLRKLVNSTGEKISHVDFPG